MLIPIPAESFTGHLGWSRRSTEPEELETALQMGCNARHLIVHLHLARLFIHGGARPRQYFT